MFLPNLGVVTAVSYLAEAHTGGRQRRAKEVTPSTVARDFSALRAVLNAAVDADRIARSPARKIALPTVRVAERH